MGIEIHLISLVYCQQSMSKLSWEKWDTIQGLPPFYNFFSQKINFNIFFHYFSDQNPHNFHIFLPINSSNFPPIVLKST